MWHPTYVHPILIVLKTNLFCVKLFIRRSRNPAKLHNYPISLYEFNFSQGVPRCFTTKYIYLVSLGRLTRTHHPSYDFLVSSHIHQRIIENIEIDELGTLRIKGKNDTDHNTITATILTECSNPHSITKIIKINNKEGWDKFKNKIKEMIQNKEIQVNCDTEYEQIIETIKRTMKESLGETTITSKHKPRENDKIKEKRNTMKEKRKLFNQACKSGSNLEKTTTLEKYTKAQTDIRKEIEKAEQETINTTMEKIIQEGGVKGNRFWKIRKNIMRTNNQYGYDLITENDREVQEPDETKEYIAEYYENLYQAREGKDKYKEWTKSIQTKTNELKHKQTGPRKPITLGEVKKAAKQLKRNKALGPDEVPNELFIEANNYTIQLLTDLLNIVHMRKNIPDEWRKGIITRLYKGKGKKGKCSNERGITVSSNIGKVYERIIDNRTRPQIKISEAQAGGREGRSTTDHLTILKKSIATQKKRKQPLYMVYLDVTKAYDKAWLDALLYVLNKRGIETENWQITNDINTNLTATIKTKYGNTREIKIRDSIRQGGVLSVLMYATVMDEIAEEINKYELGVNTNNTSHPKLGCLLYMDDVVLISNNAQEMQKMLDITNEISSRYRIVFGK